MTANRIHVHNFMGQFFGVRAESNRIESKPSDSFTIDWNHEPNGRRQDFSTCVQINLSKKTECLIVSSWLNTAIEWMVNITSANFNSANTHSYARTKTLTRYGWNGKLSLFTHINWMLSAQRYALTVILIKANDLINFYGLDTLMGTGYRSGIRCTERNFLKCPLNCIGKKVSTKQQLIYMHFGVAKHLHTLTRLLARTHMPRRPNITLRAIWV